MTESVGVAVVGLGLVSPSHLQGYRDDPRCTLAAVCDRDADRANKVGAEYGARATSDFEALLGDESIDAVALLLPHPLHHPMGLAALQAGKHVCLEKPITVTEPEAVELIEAAGAAELTLAVAENTRYVNAYTGLGGCFERRTRPDSAGPRLHPRSDSR